MSASVAHLSYDVRAALPSTPPLACYILHLMSLKRSNLCVSADVSTTAELLQLAEEVGNSICALKTHADMIGDFSERTIRGLREISRRKRFVIFEDRKFADIGSTVQHQYIGGPLQIASWAHVTNAHILPGPAIITALKAAAEESLSRVTHSVSTEISVGTPQLSTEESDADDAVDPHGHHGGSRDAKNSPAAPWEAELSLGVKKSPDNDDEGADGNQKRKGSIMSTTTIETYTEPASPPSRSLTNLHALEALGDPPQERGLLLLAEMSSEGNLLTGTYTEKCVEYARQEPEFVMGFIAQRSLNEKKGDNFLVWTPGVNLPAEGEKATTGDGLGQRYRTPEIVIKEDGCDIVIVGRGILRAKDRKKEAERYLVGGAAVMVSIAPRMMSNLKSLSAARNIKVYILRSRAQKSSVVLINICTDYHGLGWLLGALASFRIRVSQYAATHSRQYSRRPRRRNRLLPEQFFGSNQFDGPRAELIPDDKIELPPDNKGPLPWVPFSQWDQTKNFDAELFPKQEFQDTHQGLEKSGITSPFFQWNTIESSKADSLPTNAPQIPCRLFPTEFRPLSKMRSYVHLITTPTADTLGTTLLLHFDNKRYLIGNMAEGTQRACVQRSIRLTKISDIFLTGKMEWASNGGLLGMVLSVADVVGNAAQAEAELQQGRFKAFKAQHASKLKRPLNALEHEQLSQAWAEKIQGQIAANKPSLGIHGGQNLTHTLATARRFVFRKGMPLVPHEITSQEVTQLVARKTDGSIDPTWSDENIRVWAMPVKPDPTVSPLSPSMGPRKRSWDDVENADNGESSLKSPTGTDQTCRDVVTEMFDSEWRFDTLVEVKLIDALSNATKFVRNPATGRIEKYTGPIRDSDGRVIDKTVLTRTPWPGALVEKLPPTQPSPEALSYIIKNHSQRGKFLPEKAIALNVAKGRKWSELTNGQAVTSEDGETITPDMVLAVGREGNGIAVVELPTCDYVAGLISRVEWKTPNIMTAVGVVIWILGPGVIEDQRLQNFIQELKHLKHVVSAREICSNYLALESTAAATVRLNMIHESIFPRPVFEDHLVPEDGQLHKTLSFGTDADVDIRPAKRDQIVQLEPNLIFQDENITDTLDTDLVALETSEEVKQLAQKARRTLAEDGLRHELEEQQKDLPSKDAEVITLGTGSALPSKYRNVSATLLRVPGFGSYLFDAGENTMGQMRRMFSVEELKEILRDLKMIWISHLHADHHLGTTSVIKAWYEEVHGGRTVSENPQVPLSPGEIQRILTEERRLFVVSHIDMIKWLKEYSEVEDYGFNRIIPLDITNCRPDQNKTSTLWWADFCVGLHSMNTELNEKMKSSIGLVDIQAVSVSHCHGAKAVTLSFSNGFKVSYSGDCRPSMQFAKIGKGSTLLIHEATFDDELVGDAKAKKHSTTREALGVGIAMEARRVLLTHFSQRYAKIPIMDVAEGEDPVIEDGAEAVDLEQDDVPMPDPSAGGSEDSSSLPMQRMIKSGVDEGVVKIRSKADMKVAVAFDYMRVKMGEIAHLEHYTPALLKLYEEPEIESNITEAAAAGALEQQQNQGKKAKGKKKRDSEGHAAEA